MEWRQVTEFTRDEVRALAALDGRTMVAATSSGQLFQVTLGVGATLLEQTARRLNDVSRLGDGWGCVGAGGYYFSITGGQRQVEMVEPDVEFTGLAADRSGEVCVVGKLDSHSGVAFRHVLTSTGWTVVPHAAGRTSLNAVAAIDSGQFIVVGYQGLVELLEPAGSERLATGTTHPLRAVCVASSDRWLIGGGGWAQDMPILLEGNREGFKVLASAGGSRVIVGIVRDALGQIWVAENRTDGLQWNGIVSRLQCNDLAIITEFPNQRLHGIESCENVLAVHGSAGLVAWASLT